ncbi:polysulfide reductase NrfD [Pyrofollis japonicus]|uniref:NrfD/PsrC family molybdoenzyme membrane anchor subunit n=1 Tax=Pyrofollis japonicus TaxID=3060460 RepID=UPI00295BBD2E|nr:NrfD/PsrC family molybdoenzyme membrane anchor subunit [Pyrofollis japonicus]BEP16715.1 polysulfide reductase NrfD [Pyrofollis japonicus]
MEIGPDVTWSTLIALYLYLGGMAGGMWMLGFAADYADKKGEKYYVVAKTASYLAPITLAAGVLLLVLDLHRAAVGTEGLLHILNVFNNTSSSVMTIGSIIISVAIIWGLIVAIMYYANASRPWRLVFSFIAAILGFATAAYTGLLLSMARHAALWNTGWLSWLFVTSGASSGIAATIIMTRILGSFTPDYLLPEFRKVKDKWLDIAEKLHKYDVVVLWMEIAMLIGMLIDIYARFGSTPVSWLIKSTSAAVAFWSYLVLGWATPIAMYYTMPKKNKVNIYLGAILIACFALALRYAILLAPQLAWKNAGFPFH